jgi:predicted DNA-binding protein
LIALLGHRRPPVPLSPTGPAADLRETINTLHYDVLSMAASRVTTIRIPTDDLERLDVMAKRLRVDRSTLIMRALDSGVKDVLIEDGCQRYQRGEITASAAAHAAGVNLWQFLDEMKRRGVPFRTDEELLERQLEEFGRARRRR